MTKGETVRGQSPGILLILIYYHENVNDSQEVNHNENLYGSARSDCLEWVWS